MLTNTTMTWYARAVTAGEETWTRTYVGPVFWEYRKAANVLASGLVSADSATVYVPNPSAVSGMKAGDIIVRGNITKVISTSYRITQLKAEYPTAVTVTSVDPADYGSIQLQHVKIGAS